MTTPENPAAELAALRAMVRELLPKWHPTTHFQQGPGCAVCDLYRSCAPPAPPDPWQLLEKVQHSVMVNEPGGVLVHVRSEVAEEIKAALAAHHSEAKP